MRATPRPSPTRPNAKRARQRSRLELPKFPVKRLAWFSPKGPVVSWLARAQARKEKKADAKAKKKVLGEMQAGPPPCRRRANPCCLPMFGGCTTRLDETGRG